MGKEARDNTDKEALKALKECDSFVLIAIKEEPDGYSSSAISKICGFKQALIAGNTCHEYLATLAKIIVGKGEDNEPDNV